MKRRDDSKRIWIYVLVLAVIVVLLSVLFGDKVNFSPKGSDDEIVSDSAGEISDLSAQISDLIGADGKSDKTELNVKNVFERAMEANG